MRAKKLQRDKSHGKYEKVKVNLPKKDLARLGWEVGDEITCDMQGFWNGHTYEIDGLLIRNKTRKATLGRLLKYDLEKKKRLQNVPDHETLDKFILSHRSASSKKLRKRYGKFDDALLAHIVTDVMEKTRAVPENGKCKADIWYKVGELGKDELKDIHTVVIKSADGRKLKSIKVGVPGGVFVTAAPPKQAGHIDHERKKFISRPTYKRK